LKGKGVGASQGSPSSTTGNLGIKTNPLKPLKKSLGEERKRGRKPHKQKIEETWALLVDLGQVVGLRIIISPPNQKVKYEYYFMECERT
jgi:hypothetical protein